MTAALSEPIKVTLEVARVFERLGVAYAVGGSLASSVHGVPRATQDADVVAALGLGEVDALVGALGGSFYVDGDMIRDAIEREGSFNVIHLATMFKVDVFVGSDAFARQELARRQVVEVEGETLHFATPEDIVVHKLVWYRRGGEVSDRQWTDVRGVLKTCADALDEAHMQAWADRLGVRDLLDRAVREARSA